MNRQYIQLSLQEANNGKIIAYASVFDTVSASGIVIHKGAFVNSLDQLKRKGYLLYNHDRESLPLGMIEDAQEDDYGLRITASFHSTDHAQSLRRIVEERIAAGLDVAMSIAFFVDEYEQDSDGLLHVIRAEVVECSIVLFPDNPDARVVAVQEHKTLRTQLQEAIIAMDVALFEASCVTRRAKSLARLRAQDNRDISDETKIMITTLSQHIERLQAALSSIVQDLDASIHYDVTQSFDINEYVSLFEADLQ